MTNEENTTPSTSETGEPEKSPREKIEALWSEDNINIRSSELISKYWDIVKDKFPMQYPNGKLEIVGLCPNDIKDNVRVFLLRESMVIASVASKDMLVKLAQSLSDVKGKWRAYDGDKAVGWIDIGERFAPQTRATEIFEDVNSDQLKQTVRIKGLGGTLGNGDTFQKFDMDMGGINGRLFPKDFMQGASSGTVDHQSELAAAYWIVSMNMNAYKIANDISLMIGKGQAKMENPNNALYEEAVSLSASTANLVEKVIRIAQSCQLEGTAPGHYETLNELFKTEFLKSANTMEILEKALEQTEFFGEEPGEEEPEYIRELTETLSKEREDAPSRPAA